MQVYLSGRNCDVVMTCIELKAYRRVPVRQGEKEQVRITVSAEAFFYYDRRMVYRMHNGDYTVSIGTSSTEIHKTFEVTVRDGKLICL